MTTEMSETLCSCGHSMLKHDDDADPEQTPCFFQGCLCMDFEEVEK